MTEIWRGFFLCIYSGILREQTGPTEILLELLEAMLRVTLYFVQEFYPGKDSHSQKKAEHLFWDIRTKYYICIRNQNK